MISLDPKKFELSVWTQEDLDAIKAKCSQWRHKLRMMIVNQEPSKGAPTASLLTLVDGIEARAEAQLRMKRVNMAMEHKLRRERWHPGQKSTISRKKPVSMDEFVAAQGGDQ